MELRLDAGLSIESAADALGVTPKTIYRWDSGEFVPREIYLQELRRRIRYKKEERKRDTDFRFIDLFAGIGGLRLGFERAGGDCVFTSEWDTYAQRTYRANFPDDHPIAGDITKVDAADIPRHDLLVAGFPCQPFSIAGVSKKKSLGREHGFMDKAQGTLFFDVLRILRHHMPAAFLLENVKNLKSHNGGDTFRTIIGALAELGYHVSTRIIDAKAFVPQHRERIFIVGFLEDTGFDIGRLDFGDPRLGPDLGTILHDESESPEDPYTIAPEDTADNRASFVNPKYTLSDKLWAYLQAYAEGHRARGNGFGFGLNGPEGKARTLSARYYKDGSEILIRQAGTNPRRLTPRECARLMGFDRDREAQFVIPVSDTRAYKQFGNSVVVPVVEEVARYMRSHLLSIINPGELFTQPRAAG